MESPRQARKIIERCFVWLLLLVFGWAALTQYASPMVRTLSQHKNAAMNVLVLTSPALLFSYNPSSKKALITVQDKKCSVSAPQKCAAHTKFFVPKQTNRTDFWEDFKHILARWRYNPLLTGRTAWSYLTAWHERRTNLSPAEFALLVMELSRLEINDFAVKAPPATPKRPHQRSKQEVEPDGPAPLVADKAPLALQDRPIIVEVLNASGRKGLALELTQYLRELNNKGLLRVDVLQYDNYPSPQDNSWLEDYSGRPIQLKQLGNAIGINGEIRIGTTPNVICDTRIILGKDFRMPL